MQEGADPAMSEPEIRCLVVGPFQANCYLVTCPETRETVVVDPGAEAGKIQSSIESEGLKVVTIAATHGHVDHIGAADAVAEAAGAPVLIHSADADMLRSPLLSLSNLLPGGGGARRVEPDRLLEDGDTVPCGSFFLTVRHTPGHTPGGICLVIDREPEAANIVFSGDTLFAGSVGRVDFPGGDWDTLESSVRQVVYSLPDRTVVLPGHGPATTVGREKRANPFVRM